MNYIIQNKNNIQSLYIVSLLLFLFILPNISLADNLYGQTCGNRTCSQDEVCQKQYRGVLPIGSQNTGSATYTCVKPQAIEAPESPYKGEIGCGAGLGLGSSFTSGLGSIGSGLLNSVTGGILGGTLSTSLNNIAGDFLGNLTAPFGIKLDGTLTGILNDPIGAFTGNFTDMIGLNDLVDECYYNNIDRVIDTRRLIAPLPVDLFNPLPLPVNVTSPTPLPVVVVDDLALYQQKELIDAPLAAQQKAKTIATVSDTLRYQISNDNLIPNNYFAINQLGIQFGAKDSETGVIPQAIDKYSNYANIPTELLNGDLAKSFTDLQDPLISKLPPETFTGKCGNIKVEEATTLECQLLGLYTNNNANDIKTNTVIEAAYKSQEASKLLSLELENGNGYFSKSNGENVFTKQIQTPGSNISSLSEKVTEATIDQAILAAGDNCFEAIPKNILDGTLKPVLTQGLYGVNNTLSSVLNNATTNPVNTLQNPQALAIQLKDSTTNQFNPDRFFRSLQDSLVQNVTDGLSCELNKQISGLLNGIIGNVTLPGIGNVNSLITNTVSNGVNNLVQDGVNNLIR